ncbi:4'-phosphopantetheinyl transferase superfamily protein [Christensenella sp. MSJ-20]|uniref:4'-phosphopantetheinyl transferase family protein n=1 Tax=Christensenella sp. MSJ-20 TaxID=2841518 RepID=UPI001C779141|nr:4'-phosphopantetheinyl transferase superfamily protein [Christensenella sp. MSJ-20]
MADHAVQIHIYPEPHSTGRTERLLGLSRAYALSLGQNPASITSPLRSQEGKPYFPHAPWLHFSITHSGDYWLCALGTIPLGLDLQRHQDCDRAAIAQRFFHPLEQSYLEHTAYQDFYSIWAAKESYLKYTGQGLPGGLNGFSVVADGALAASVNGAALHHLPFSEEYSLCLCGQLSTPIQLQWHG